MNDGSAGGGVSIPSSSVDTAPSGHVASRDARARFGAALAGAVYFLFLAGGHAWLCDDAYITFRTIENFVAGRGLTWNPGERVQVFTHPAWMFLLSGLRYVTGEIYWTSLGAGLGLSLAAFVLLIARFARTWPAALLATGVLTASKAFVDYSTSGLENPLTHLLLVLHAANAFSTATPDTRLLRGALLTSLLTLTIPISWSSRRRSCRRPRSRFERPRLVRSGESRSFYSPDVFPSRSGNASPSSISDSRRRTPPTRS